MMDIDCPEEPMVASPGRLDLRAVWQLTSMSLGVGIFAIPMCFKVLGVLQGGILVVVLGLCANTAIERLLDCAELQSRAKYEEIANVAFGRAGQCAMAFVIGITTFIASLSYLAAATELLVCVVYAFLTGEDINQKGSSSILSKGKRAVVLFIFVMISMPKLLKRSMGDNALISTAGVFSMSAAALIFVVNSLMVLASCQEPCQRPALVSGQAQEILENMATLAFSFSMVFAVFPLVGDKATACGSIEAAVRSMRNVVRTSIGFSVCIYLLVGLSGAFAYGDDIRKLALQNLSLKEALPQVTLAVVGVCSLLLVAIVGFPCIESIELFCKMAQPGLRDVRVAIVCLVGLLCVAVDAFIDTKIAFALTGALGLSLGAYVMPALLYLRLRDPSMPGTTYRFWSAIVLLCFGSVVLLGGTPATVMAAIDDHPSQARLGLLQGLLGYASQ